MIHPYANRILVKRWPEVDQHESGLWLPSDAREKPQLGDVYAVGFGFRCKHGERIPIDIAIDDVVVFEKFVSNDFQVTHEGSEWLILPYSRVYAVISGLPNLSKSYKIGPTGGAINHETK